MKNFICCCFFFLFLFNSFAQTDRTFIKHYGTAGSEYGMSLTVEADNSIIFVQTIFDSPPYGMAITRTDANGTVIWTTPFSIRDITIPKQIEKLNNSFLVYGTTWNSNSSDFVLFLACVSDGGNVLWVKEYDASAADLASGFVIQNDKIFLAATADYNVGSLYPKALIIKTDLNGTVEATKMLNARYQLNCFSIALAPNGKLGLGCTTNSAGTGAPIFLNLAITQLDRDLQVEWTKIAGVYYDDEINMLAWSGTDWVIAGRTYFIASEWDVSVFRFDQTGNLISSAFYDSGSDDAGRAIAVDANASVLIGGDAGTFDERNMTLFKIDSSNDILWSHQYPVSTLFTNYLFDVEKLNGDSGYVFTGDLRPTGAFRDAPLFRTNSMGEIKCYTGSINYTKINPAVEVTDTVLHESIPQITDVTVPSPTLQIAFHPTILCDIFDVRFSYTTTKDCPANCLSFKDESINSILWYWEFPGGTPAMYSGQQPPEICFDSVRSTTVKLMGWNGTDTLSWSQTLTFENDCDTFFIPNVITPNTDGLNDRFVIKNLPDNFKLRIFNRWGNSIFETSSHDYIWPKQEEKISDGIYFYTLEMPDKSLNGTVSVIGNTD